MSVFDKKSEGHRKPFIRVGFPAPNFKGTMVTSDNKFAPFELKDYRRRTVFLCFFPMCFTYVCPTEMISINNHLQDFDARGTEVIVISTDSHHVMLQWKNTPVHQGGIGCVQYPMFSDMTRKVSQMYGMVFDDVDGEDGEFDTEHAAPLRGNFIIDREGILQHYSVNNYGVGRNFEEVIRLVDAIQFHEKHGDVCPAGWTKGKEAMKPTRDGVSDYLTSNAERL